MTAELLTRIPKHRGERDTERDTQDWADKTFMGYVPKGPGRYRESPYAAFRYIVKEK